VVLGEQVAGAVVGVAVVLVLAALAVPAVAGGQKLVLRVSPAVAQAPAILTVRTTVETDADNRALAIVVESATFHRSSEIPLDGASAPRLNVVELRDIPSGLYEVRATLVGAHGPRANSMQLVKVEPGFGGR
jgi:hypothetical protein